MQKADAQLCGCHSHVTEVVCVLLAVFVPEQRSLDEILLTSRAAPTFILREQGCLLCMKFLLSIHSEAEVHYDF